MQCEHKFVRLETKKNRHSAGWQDCFTKIDVFFCEKCLEEKIVKKEEYSRNIPDWY